MLCHMITIKKMYSTCNSQMSENCEKIIFLISKKNDFLYKFAKISYLLKECF